MGFPLGQNSVKVSKGVLSGHEKVLHFLFSFSFALFPFSLFRCLFVTGTRGGRLHGLPADRPDLPGQQRRAALQGRHHPGPPTGFFRDVVRTTITDFPCSSSSFPSPFPSPCRGAGHQLRGGGGRLLAEQQLRDPELARHADAPRVRGPRRTELHRKLSRLKSSGKQPRVRVVPRWSGAVKL